MTKAEILRELEGQEIQSIQFEDLVTVEDGKVKRFFIGDTITPTKAQAEELLEEAFEAEFGTRNTRQVLINEGII